MTATDPHPYLIAVFPSRKLLVRALDALRSDRALHILKAAIVARADDGEVTIVDDSLGPDEAGITGGTFGAAVAMLGMVQFGALALPGIGVIIALGAGALVGGLVGNATGRFAVNLMEGGYRADQIDALKLDLEADRPALVLHVRQNDTDSLTRVTRSLERFRGRVIAQPQPVTSA